MGGAQVSSFLAPPRGIMQEQPMHNVLVTGSSGFIGSRLCTRLEELGIKVTRSKVRLDLAPSDEASAIDFTPFDTVFHLAGLVGGITFNIANPAVMLTTNLRITLNVIDAWARAKTAKLIVPGSSCAYPDTFKTLQESMYLQGEPHWSNLEYAYAKRMILVALRAYQDQHKLDFAYPILANVYGPGAKYNPSKSHVIPAIAAKFLDTSKPVEVLGNGRTIRDFLYIDDAVSALIHSALSQPSCYAMNYGTGIGYSVSDIVDKFAELAGRDDVEFNSDAPAGQPYRVLDCRMADSRGWRAQVEFGAGLEMTFEWVKEWNASK